jgi:hypothetical protein
MACIRLGLPQTSWVTKMKTLFTILMVAMCASANAAMPDTITDPAVRDALEYIDAKADRSISFITNLSTTIGGAVMPLGITYGGTGQTTAASALAALGGVGFDGAGAAGTWPINISGTVDVAKELYYTPGLCSLGQAALGINKAGSAQGCWTPDSADNLGNHTATTNLNLATHNIINAGTVTATSFAGSGANLTNLPATSGVFQLDADGNVTPDDLIVRDMLWEVIGSDILPL